VRRSLPSAGRQLWRASPPPALALTLPVGPIHFARFRVEAGANASAWERASSTS
jgi:hypothetical protein